MLRANIFQQNISANSQSEIVNKILNFNHALVEITPNQISVKKNSGGELKFAIEFFEKDMYTTTHTGKFDDGVPFRLIQPYGMALETVKSKHNSKGAFSLGSLNPDGFAIHFILTDPNDIRSNDITYKGNNEQIQKLIEGAFMSLQFGLQQNFIEITKRLISLIGNNPSGIKTFNDGDKLAQIMKDNLDLYDSNEQKIVKQI